MDFNKAVDNLIGLATGSKDPLTLNAVMEVQRHLIKIQEENRVLREELHDLKNSQYVKEGLNYSKENNSYYIDGKEDELYCSSCLDSIDKRIRMIMNPDGWSETLKAKCPVCKNKVTTIIRDPLYEESL